MATHVEHDAEEYVVLVNEYQEYRLWPSESPVPSTWTAIGPPRQRSACLNWIVANWSDMYPITLFVRSNSGRGL